MNNATRATKKLWKMLREVEVALAKESDVGRAEALKARRHEILARLDERNSQ